MSSLFLKINVVIPGMRNVQCVSLRPNVTLGEAVRMIAEKYGQKELRQRQLVIPPKSKKKGGQVFGTTAVLSHLGLTEKDTLELWEDPRMIKVAADDGKKEHSLALDFGQPFKEMMPVLQSIFYRKKKPKPELVALCSARGLTQENWYWLSVNRPLNCQSVTHESKLMLYTMNVIPGLSMQFFSPPVMQGFLYLEDLTKSKGSGRGKKKGNKQYWFILKPPLLLYWSKQKKVQKSAAKGLICLDRFTVQRVDTKGPIYPYLLHKENNPFDYLDKDKKDEDESYILSAESNGEMKAWMNEIKPMCINSEITRVFSMPIKSLIARNKNKEDPIPPILRKTIQNILEKGLDTEGIFRVCGSSQDIESYKQRFDDGEDVDLASCQDIHIVCGLLKLFLRELPEPILTFELYDCFVAAYSNLRNFNPGPDVIASKLAVLLLDLPEEHFQVLQYLLEFLANVAKHSNSNLMTLENLATIFGPNLLRRANGGTTEVLEDFAVVSEICETLISQQHLIIQKVEELRPKTPRGTMNGNGQAEENGTKKVKSPRRRGDESGEVKKRKKKKDTDEQPGEKEAQKDNHTL